MSVPPPPPDAIPAEAVPEPLPRAEAPADAPAAGLAAPAGTPAAALGSAGLSELAHAFTANAQALEGVGALQVRLLEALKRGDRSELVVASAQGLNESFRNLGAIQKALLEQLEKLRAPAAPPAANRAVPLLLLGLCGVLVLATWAVVGALRDLGSNQTDPRALNEHTAQLLQAGRDDAAQSARQEAQRLQSLVADGEERTRRLQERLDAEREAGAQRERDLSAKESELDALRRQAASAQNEALKMVSLENEIKLLSADAALVEPRVRGMERELEEQRRENTRLRQRIASSELGYEQAPDPPPPSTPAPAGPRLAPLTGPPPGAPPPPPAGPTAPLGDPASRGAPTVTVLRPNDPTQPLSVVPSTAPARPAPAPPGPQGPAPAGAVGGSDVSRPGPASTPSSSEPPSTRDPQVVEQVRATLNTLLEGTRARRPDYWTLQRVDGVASDRLRGVLAQRHDSTGRVVETVEAREALVWLDAGAKRVSLELLQGVRTLNGQRGDFHEGRMEAIVADGDGASLFARSGLRILRHR